MVGIIYPNLLYCDEQMKPVTLKEMPATCRNPHRVVSTPSLWLASAVRKSGGWQADEGTLAERVIADGFDVVHGSGVVNVRRHPDNPPHWGGDWI